LSTKTTIRSRARTAAHPGYHLYEDDPLGDDDEEASPVYLQLDGVSAELRAPAAGGAATLTVTLPRELARALGLLPAATPPLPATS